jgi:hypothetical protein
VGAGSLAALLISEQRTSLFGFMEHGCRPIIAFAIASDMEWRSSR